jgi:D-inositol-3-phosphate glycosyltransferase
MLAVHSSPLATLGGKEAGGMNVYVRELARELGRRGIPVDIFTRSQRRGEPQIVELGPNARVVTLRTGPTAPYDKNWVLDYLPEFVSRIRCFADGQDLHYDLIHSHYCFQVWPHSNCARCGTHPLSICFTHSAR